MEGIIIFLSIVLGICFALFIYLEIASYKVRKKVFLRRYEYGNTLKFNSFEDYDGLKKEDHTIASKKNNYNLRGYVYYYEKDEYKGLMLMYHSLGVGHRQQMEEIAYFASIGYKVFALDFTGCGESENDEVGGFPQAIIDVKLSYEYINSIDCYRNMNKYVFAFSMGAYGAINALHKKEDVKAMVLMSLFDCSYEQLAQELFHNQNGSKIFSTLFKGADFRRFGKISKMKSGQSLVDSSIPCLVISGELDNVVNPIKNFEMFKECLEEDKSKEFMLVKDRYYKPNMSLEAARYDNQTNEEYYKLIIDAKGKLSQDDKKVFYDSLDYDLLHELDNDVMEKIKTFFAKY